MPVPVQYRDVARIGAFAYRKARNRKIFSLKPYLNRAIRASRSIGMAKYGGRRTRRGKTPFARAVRKVILNTTEKCYRSKVIVSGTGGAINHDSLRPYSLWENGNMDLFPTQGLGDSERIGDEIYVTGIMVRATFEIPQDRRNTKIKLWFVPHNTDQGVPSTQSQFQHNVSGNTFLDPIQTDRWKGIKYLGMHQLKSTDQTTGEQDKSIMRKFWIPIYRKVTFQTDTSQTIASGLTERGWIVATAYDTFSTLTTDTVVNRAEMTATLYYKCP
jgi:hypothetical protein